MFVSDGQRAAAARRAVGRRGLQSSAAGRPSEGRRFEAFRSVIPVGEREGLENGSFFFFFLQIWYVKKDLIYFIFLKIALLR